jgi:hypothetical protein
MNRPLSFCALSATLAISGAAGAASASSYNPAISVILDGRYSQFSEDPAAYHLPGFQLGPESGPGERGFAFHEAELMMTSNVDDMFRATLIASFGQDAGETATEIEEAWIETTSLPDGLVVKAGRFFSRVGYLNERHPHGWDFADAPLVNRAFFGANLSDSGVQLRWIAPTELFLELGGEWFAGNAWPAAGASDQGRGMYTLFAKLGGDLDDSNSWQVGISRIAAQAVDRTDEPLDPTAPPPLAFTGDSTVTGIDFIWKWAPDGNYKDRNLTLTAELMQRDEEGALATDFGGGPETGAYTGTQRGWYAQGAWQFMPQWRVGLRLDRLTSDNTVTGLSQPTVLDSGGHSPQRTSVMVDYSHTEFSRIRLQYNRDGSTPVSDSQLILQYVVSIGPHGAHQF